jgi:cytochrome c peroxidase
LNPVEQNTDELTVCKRVAKSDYAELFRKAWGEPSNCSNKIYGLDVTGDLKTYEVNYRRFMVALSAYQASWEVNSFSSKRDKALAKDTDGFPLDDFNNKQNRGHNLFYGKTITLNPEGKPARCFLCHGDNPAADKGEEPFQLYADDAYHKIGVPLNLIIPGNPGPNLGLAGHTGDSAHLANHKSPTLRNVDKRPWKGFTKAHSHNGWFKSLESIVHFYNTAAMQEDLDAAFPSPNPLNAKLHNVCRCPPEITTLEEVLAYDEDGCEGCWPAPESTNASAIPFIVGNLWFTSEEEAGIVAYLKTLTDTEKVDSPKPYK